MCPRAQEPKGPRAQEEPKGVQQFRAASSRVKLRRGAQEPKSPSSQGPKSPRASSRVKLRRATSSCVELHQAASSRVKPRRAASSRVEPRRAASSRIEPRRTASSRIKQRRAASSCVEPRRAASSRVEPRRATSSRVEPRRARIPRPQSNYFDGRLYPQIYSLVSSNKFDFGQLRGEKISYSFSFSCCSEALSNYQHYTATQLSQ
jgi:hypothetical protein